MPYDFDAFFIGGGQASVPLAGKLIGEGWRVGLAEREHLGGSCVNFGCMPSKAVHASARVADFARRGQEFGVDVEGVRPDLPRVFARARQFSREARLRIESGLREAGVSLHVGSARIEDRHEAGFVVRVGGGRLTARHVVLDPGSRTYLPDVPGLADAAAITSETWVDRPEVGGRVVLLGGGYIGVEMAQFYRRMGREVTVIQKGGQILDREDADVAGGLQACLEAEGVSFRLGVDVRAVRREAGETVVDLPGESIACDTLFVATGRHPDTSDLGLDQIGLKVGERGAIETDDFGQVHGHENLWVGGDARGGPAFTHAAHDDHHILLSALLGRRDPGGSRDRSSRLVPYAVFTDPELGRVGMSVDQAKRQGIEHRVITVEMKTNDRARTIGQPAGFVKLVVKPDDEGTLLGATLLGADAGELVHAFIMLMHLGRGLASIHDAIFVHPTRFEVVHQAVDRWAKSR
jgi:pyruvate/2-oxoglutarate dehydrogenase complex dihydrolipoamide dehydrogenase (E3) component